MDPELHKTTNCPRGHIVPGYQYHNCPLCKIEDDEKTQRQREVGQRKRKQDNQETKTESEPRKPPVLSSTPSFKAGALAFVGGFLYLAGAVQLSPIAAAVFALIGAVIFATFFRQILGVAAVILVIFLFAKGQTKKDDQKVEVAPKASVSSSVNPSVAERVAAMKPDIDSAETEYNSPVYVLGMEPSDDSKDETNGEAGPDAEVAPKTSLPVQESTSSKSPTTPIDDRLFTPAVYEMLKKYGKVDGGFVNEDMEGKVLSREWLAHEAVFRFERHAKLLGIQLREITEAMLKGELNPYALDMVLVWEGLGRAYAESPKKPIPPEKLTADRQTSVEETDRYHAAKIEYRHDMANYRNEIDAYRTAAWAERYGRIGDIEEPGVNTIIDDRNCVADGHDLALRMVQKTTSNSNLETLGLSDDVTLRFNHAEAIVRTKSPRLQDYFDDRIERMRGLCPVQYFDLTYHDWRHYVRDSANGYATYADYRALRSIRYLPRLRSVGYVTNPKIEASVKE